MSRDQGKYSYEAVERWTTVERLKTWGQVPSSSCHARYCLPARKTSNATLFWNSDDEPVGSASDI